ncbi:MAG: hypothetical protein KDG44_10975 [Burkholderiaceae bacterium]|jgi:hypothetical protein|nr:hypothetical protein [Burkholderiaceae bacterium]
MLLSIHARAFVLACAVAAVAPSAVAQPAPPDPATAGTPVPPLIYRSAFAGYRPLPDDKATAWRSANDKAAAFGGWRAYAREVRLPEPAASSANPQDSRRAP